LWGDRKKTESYISRGVSSALECDGSKKRENKLSCSDFFKGFCHKKGNAGSEKTLGGKGLPLGERLGGAWEFGE